MAFGLKKLFAKKEGGSAVGNFIRKATTGLADKVGLGFVVEAINPIPTAPVKVQETAVQALQYVTQLPALSFTQAQSVAKQAENKIIASGGTEEEAKVVAQKVEAVAQEPAKALPSEPVKPKATVPVKLSDLDGTLAASQALGTPLSETPKAIETLAAKTGKSKAEILDIFKDGLIAAKDQMVQSWLDKTDSGKQTRNEAIWGQLETYAPYILGGVGAYVFAKKQGWIK